jgi:hypothetical protein
MKGISACVVTALALFSMASVWAADTDQANVMRIYTDSVAPPDQVAYEAGVKDFNKCLSIHGFTYAWTAWLHETGDTYQYSYVSAPLSWSAFDAMREQGKACLAAWQGSANPHMKGEISSFAKVMPELSHMTQAMGATAPLMEVTFFKLKPGHEAVQTFIDEVKKISAAAEKSGWANHYMMSQVMDGDHGAPDYILLSYSTSWADFGKQSDTPVWTMVEGVYGKEAAAAMRKSINGAVQEMSSHIDSRSVDLSYSPPGK